MEFDYRAHIAEILGDGFIVTDLRNVNVDLSKPNVVINYMPGTINEESSDQQVQLDIYTDDPENMMDIMTDFAKTYHNNKFVLDGMVIQEHYTTPTIFERDVQIGGNIYARITVFCNLMITYNVSDIENVTFDGELIDLQSVSVSYVAQLHTKIIDGVSLSTNVKTSSSAVISVSGINKNKIMLNKVREIRQGKLDGNTTFAVKINYIDGYVEEYTCILSQNNASFQRSALPGFSATFAVA